MKFCLIFSKIEKFWSYLDEVGYNLIGIGSQLLNYTMKVYKLISFEKCGNKVVQYHLT